MIGSILQCPGMIFEGAFMDLRPTQGDENWVEEGLFGDYT